MLVQPASADHTSGITEIVTKLRLTEFKTNPAQFNWSELSIKDELMRSRTWVATEDQQVVAFLSARELPEAYEITVLGTDPAWQGRGFQSELVNRLFGMATLAQKQIWLEVHAANLKALAFYGKCGFKQVSRRKSYYTDGGDAILMVLGL